jgi:hypothetical protein
MSKYKTVLTGIKDNATSQGLNIPQFEKVNPENATKDDVQKILSDLRIMKNLYENQPQGLNLENAQLKVVVLGQAIDDILDFPGEDFQ